MATYFTVYKITNKINGKVYIGTHKTDDLDDGYMGSGKYLNAAINKYGVEQFEKVILHQFATSEEMFAKEAELVNEDYLANENTYNLRVGGFGGWDFINRNVESRTKKNQKARRKTDFILNQKYGVINPGQLVRTKAINSARMKQMKADGFYEKYKVATDEELVNLLHQFKDARSPVKSVMRHLGKALSGGLCRRTYKLYSTILVDSTSVRAGLITPRKLPD